MSSEANISRQKRPLTLVSSVLKVAGSLSDSGSRIIERLNRAVGGFEDYTVSPRQPVLRYGFAGHMSFAEFLAMRRADIQSLDQKLRQQNAFEAKPKTLTLSLPARNTERLQLTA